MATALWIVQLRPLAGMGLAGLGFLANVGSADPPGATASAKPLGCSSLAAPPATARPAATSHASPEPATAETATTSHASPEPATAKGEQYQ